MIFRISFFLPTIILALAALPASGQRLGTGTHREFAKSANPSSDSISATAARYSAALDSIILMGRQHQLVSAAETLYNPYYFPLFSCSTLYGQPLNAVLATISQPATYVAPDLSLRPRAVNAIYRAMLYSYANQPGNVRHDLTASLLPLPDADTAVTKPKADKSKPSPPQETQTPTNVAQKSQEIHGELAPGDFHITVRRPNFWNVKGNFSTKFMQYYVTENWHKGGDDYLSMLGEFNIEANYNNKQKLTVNNRLETRLGFQTISSDTHHKFKTNADLIRLTNKIGLQATKHWYYTLTLQSWTQFYKTYNANSDDVTSDFMSPFEATVSLGMDYRLNKKKANLTASLSPIAINVKYCDRSNIVTRFGIDAGKHSKTKFGSTVTINGNVNFSSTVSWNYRFYAFYDYKNLKMEWENTINVRFNKYLSTKLFLYPRFDNSVAKREDHKSYFQFNEYVSIGLDFSF